MLRIVYYPHPTLQKRAEAVDPDRPGLRDLVDGMLLAMKEASGVGLAAPQVGESIRLFVASDTADPEDSRPYFSRLRELRDLWDGSCCSSGSLAELSMGMTIDFEVAVEEGATLVRVGSAIFGSRPTGV